MSTTKQQVQSLYRAYLRLVRDWPTDQLRPNRNMKQVLAARVEETFRTMPEHHHSIDLSNARSDLDALQRLLDNEFKEKYPLSERILNPASNPNYYSSLIASLEATKAGKKTFLEKLLGR